MMKTMHIRTPIVVPLVLVIIMITTLMLLLPVGAAPSLQAGESFPTPTLYPVDNVDYTLDVVGGAEDTFTFSHPDQDGFVLGDTTFVSHYPLGMEFRVSPSSDSGDITAVILFIEFPNGRRTRANAVWDGEAWVATMWDTLDGIAAWVPFSFAWNVRDASDAVVETAPQPLTYVDPTREWFRMESDYVVAYWFGFSEDDPDFLAERIAYAMAAVTPRYEAGFGTVLSFKPTTVIYASGEAFVETQPEGIIPLGTVGNTNPDRALITQSVPGDTANAQNECTLFAGAFTPVERADFVTYTTTLLTGFLYQSERDLRGPLWWNIGQVRWFSTGFGGYDTDARLRALANMQPMPQLEDAGFQMDTADECDGLPIDMGASFINYVLATSGGIEAHQMMVEEMRAGSSVYEAVETVAGQPFFDVENAWRAYLGIEPLNLADIDPASALEPYEDSLLAVGDSVVLPAAPMLVKMYEDPGEGTLPGPQCFANTPVTILQMGTLDEIAYFKIDCMGMTGWVQRETLVGP